MPDLMGNIQALGKIRGIIGPRIFPKARNFPDLFEPLGQGIDVWRVSGVV